MTHPAHARRLRLERAVERGDAEKVAEMREEAYRYCGASWRRECDRAARAVKDRAVN